MTKPILVTLYALFSGFLIIGHGLPTILLLLHGSTSGILVMDVWCDYYDKRSNKSPTPDFSKSLDLIRNYRGQQHTGEYE